MSTRRHNGVRTGHLGSRPGECWREAKRPKLRIAGTYGSPMHSTLVPVPIGTWLASLVFSA
jgi:hypothetical protein